MEQLQVELAQNLARSRLKDGKFKPDGEQKEFAKSEL